MSSGSVRRVSRQDIQLVQNLIERCLQLYMSQKEIVNTLEVQAKIEPDFTELVWQKLEEENVEFFRAYHTRLVLKQQIVEFNSLLEQQVQVMHLDKSKVARQPTSNGTHNSSVSSLPNSNGPYIGAIPEHPAFYPAEQTPPPLRPENMQHRVQSSLSNLFNNGGSSLDANMHSVVGNGMSTQGNRINGPPSMLSTQNSNFGMIQGINGGIKSAPGYSSSPYMFGADRNVLEARPTVGDASASNSFFTNVGSNAHSVNEAARGPDTSSFGFLGQIPRNFSLSDLTADFSQSSDILESYCRSPFLLPADHENGLERQEQDNNRLDSISEGLSYEDFDSK